MGDDLLIRVDATVAGYEAAMARAERSTLQYDSALKRTSLQLATLEKQMNDEAAAKLAAQDAALTKVGKGFGVVGLAAGVALGVAIKKAADFNAKLAQVHSLLRATGDQAATGALAQAAKGFANLGISATDAADAEIELIKAGISAKDIIGGALKGTLVLAAAGQMDVATATEIAASAMTQFGLAGKDIPHVADLLAAGADKALGSVQDLGEGLGSAGTTANQMGLSIEDTVGTLAAFANAGILGEKGGTVLRQALLKLSAPSEKASKLMEKFNLSLYDANGQMKSVPTIAGNLQKAFSDATPAVRNNALSVIFGARAIQGANVLLREGRDGMTQWIAKVNDQGFAAQQAAGKMQSLTGDLDKFKASVTNLFISLGQSGQGPLRILVQGLTKFVDAMNGAPDIAKSTAAALLALFATVGIGVYALTKLKTAVTSTKANLKTLGFVGEDVNKKMLLARAGALGLGIGLAELNSHIKTSDEYTHDFLSTLSQAAIGYSIAGPIGGALGTVAGLLETFSNHSQAAAAAQQKLDAAAGEAADSLNKETGALSGTTAEIVRNFLASEGAYSAAEKMGINLGLVTKAALGNKTAIAEVTKATKDWLAIQSIRAGRSVNSDEETATANKLTDAIGAQSAAIAKRREELDLTNRAQAEQNAGLVAQGHAVDEFGNAIKATTSATEKNTGANKSNADSLNKEADAANKAYAAHKKLADLLLGNVDKQIAYRNAVRAAKDGLDKFNGSALDGTAKGDAFLSKLVDVANTFNELPPKVRNSTSAFQASRATFVGLATDMGIPIEKARQMASNWLVSAATISKTKPKVDVDTDGANSKLDGVANKTRNLPDGNVSIQVAAQQAISTISSIAGLLTGLHDKTVHVSTVNTVLDRHLTQNHADGGLVLGPGGPRDDMINARLSNGEFVVNAAATRRNLPLLSAINAQRFANGGRVGGGVPDVISLDRLLRMLRNPGHVETFGDVRRLRGDTAAEMRDVVRAERELHAARNASKNIAHAIKNVEHDLDRARNAEEKSSSRLADVEEKIKGLRKDHKPVGEELLRTERELTKQHEADSKEVKRLTDLSKNRAHAQKAADRDLQEAEDNLSKQRDQATAAAQKQKDAQQALVEQSKTWTATVLELGSAFGGEGSTGTAQGLFSKLRHATSSGNDFEDALKTLARKHLDPRLMREIRDEGPSAQGLALATSLASAPKSLIAKINRQQSALESVAASIGTFGTGAGRSHGHGGHGGHGHGGKRVEVNLNGPIHTHDVHAAAKAIHAQEKRALAIAGQS